MALLHAQRIAAVARERLRRRIMHSTLAVPEAEATLSAEPEGRQLVVNRVVEVIDTH